MAQRNAVKIAILGDASQFQKTLDSVDRGIAGFSNKLGRMTTAVGAVFATDKIVDFARSTVDMASSVEESISKVNTIFGRNGDEVVTWAEGLNESLKLSDKAALELVGSFGNLATGLSITGDAAVEFAQNNVTAIADLASFHNASMDQVSESVQAAYRGEFDSIQRYLPYITSVSVKERAVQMGLIEDVNDALDGEAQAAATLSLIYDNQLNPAIGDMARTGDSFENTQRELAANFADLQRSIGERLLPVADALVQFLNNSVIPAFDEVLDVVDGVGGVIAENAGYFQALGIVIGGIVTGGALVKLKDQVSDLILNLRTMPSADIAKFKTLAVNVGLATAAIGIATFAIGNYIEKKRETERRIKAATEALVDETGQINLNTKAWRDNLLVQSRFATNDQIDDIARLGLTVEDLNNLIMKGNPGLVEFNRLILDSGEVSLRAAGSFQKVGDNIMVGSVAIDASLDPFEELNRMYLDGEISVGDYTHAMRNLLDGNDSLIVSFGEQQTAVRDATREQAEALTVNEDLTKTQRDHLASLVESAEETGNWSAVIAEVNKLQGELGETTGETAEAADGYSGAIGGAIEATEVWTGAVKKAKEALDKLFGIQKDLDTATLDYEESLDSLYETLLENGATWDANTEAGRDNLTTARDLAAAQRDLTLAELQSGQTIEAVQAKEEARLKVLRDTLIATGMSAEEADRLIEVYGRVPEEVKTEFQADTAPADRAMNNSIRVAENWDRSTYTATFDADMRKLLAKLAAANEMLPGARRVPVYGRGGLVKGGVPGIVGEEPGNDELVIPLGPNRTSDRDRVLREHGHLLGMMGGQTTEAPVAASGGTSVTVNVVSQADPWDIGREVAWAMRTGGR